MRPSTHALGGSLKHPSSVVSEAQQNRWSAENENTEKTLSKIFSNSAKRLKTPRNLYTDNSAKSAMLIRPVTPRLPRGHYRRSRKCDGHRALPVFIGIHASVPATVVSLRATLILRSLSIAGCSRRLRIAIARYGRRETTRSFLAFHVVSLRLTSCHRRVSSDDRPWIVVPTAFLALEVPTGGRPARSCDGFLPSRDSIPTIGIPESIDANSV